MIVWVKESDHAKQISAKKGELYCSTRLAGDQHPSRKKTNDVVEEGDEQCYCVFFCPEFSSVLQSKSSNKCIALKYVFLKRHGWGSMVFAHQKSMNRDGTIVLHPAPEFIRALRTRSRVSKGSPVAC